ncbi:MAG: amino acid-binding protein [Desulfurella sp.]
MNYKITQISVFIENKKGRFYNVTKILKENNINIRALNLADTNDFGILRFCVDKPEAAYEALKKEHFIVKKNEILAALMDDRPGGLMDLLEIINEADLNIEYVYTFVNAKDNHAVILFKFENIDEAYEKLKNKIHFLDQQYFIQN